MACFMAESAAEVTTFIFGSSVAGWFRFLNADSGDLNTAPAQNPRRLRG